MWNHVTGLMSFFTSSRCRGVETKKRSCWPTQEASTSPPGRPLRDVFEDSGAIAVAAPCAAPPGRPARRSTCPPHRGTPCIAPDALVRADAPPPAILALAPSALVLADACAPALLALATFPLVLADARPPALLAVAPFALVLTDARASTLLASIPRAEVMLARWTCPAELRRVPLGHLVARG
jgi:hypothetical protein